MPPGGRPVQQVGGKAPGDSGVILLGAVRLAGRPCGKLALTTKSVRVIVPFVIVPLARLLWSAGAEHHATVEAVAAASRVLATCSHRPRSV